MRTKIYRTFHKRFATPTRTKNLALLDSSRVIVIAALLIILGFGVLRDSHLLFQNNVAVGVDGYYYVLQVQAIKNQHRLYFSTPTPFILDLLAELNYLENDPVKAVKIGSLALYCLLSVGIFALIASATHNLWLGVFGSTLAVVPQAHLYLTGEFINQLGALTLLVWAGWFAFSARQSDYLRGAKIGGSIALTVAAALSHKLGIVIALMLIVFGLLIVTLSRSVPWQAAALLTIVFIWLSPAIVSVQTLTHVPDWLRGQVSSRPHSPFGGPLFAPTLMLAIASVVVLCLAIKSTRKVGPSPGIFVFGSISLASLVIILNPFLNPEIGLGGVAVRFRVLSHVGAALLVPASISFVYLLRREAAVYLGAVFLPLLILSALAPLPYGLLPEYLARRERLVESLKFHSPELTQNSIVIAPHGDQFVVTATTGVPSQQRPPQNRQYDKIYWLLNEVSDSALRNGLIMLFRNHSATTTLIDDALFRSRWDKMTEIERNQLLPANPHVARSFPLTHPDSVRY